jgi:nucleoside-diphosphate-sugar epimerase
MMTFKRVLVTGAAGLLGRSVIEELRRHYQVRAFDLKRGAPDVEWHIGDLTDAVAVAAAVRDMDAIVHVGAIPNIWSGGGEKIMQVNVLGTYLLFAAAEQAGVKRVAICSSDSTVGFTVREGSLRPPEYLPIDIEHPLNPTDPYGLSKVLGEEIGRSFALRGKMSVVALRPVFIAYPEMYGEIRARAASPKTYSGTPAGGPSSAGGGPCWHHVDPRDVAAAFRKALELEGVTFEKFFISAAVTLSPTPTLERLREVLGTLPPVRRPEVYRDNPFAPLFDLSLARERLGFVPQFDTRSISLEAMAK